MVSGIYLVRTRIFFVTFFIQSRQELCESFEWFKSYQSGVYHRNGTVKGYLLSAYASRYVNAFLGQRYKVEPFHAAAIDFITTGSSSFLMG